MSCFRFTLRDHCRIRRSAPARSAPSPRRSMKFSKAARAALHIQRKNDPGYDLGSMKYRTLGSTGLSVSVIGIGTWQLGGEWGKDFAQDEVNAMFRRARELGINLVDTAECYGDHVSERLVGEAI